MEKYYLIVKPSEKIVFPIDRPFKHDRSTFEARKRGFENMVKQDLYSIECGESHYNYQSAKNRLYDTNVCKVYGSDKSFFRDYKKSGWTTFLNRDRYNDVVNQILKALYAKFEEWKDEKVLIPYNPSEFKIKNQYTQYFMRHPHTPIMVACETGQTVYAIDVMYYAENYWRLGEFVWWENIKVPRTISSVTTVKIRGNGRLEYRTVYDYHYSNFRDYVNNEVLTQTDDPESWDKWLGDLRKILV